MVQACSAFSQCHRPLSPHTPHHLLQARGGTRPSSGGRSRIALTVYRSPRSWTRRFSARMGGCHRSCTTWSRLTGSPGPRMSRTQVVHWSCSSWVFVYSAWGCFCLCYLYYNGTDTVGVSCASGGGSGSDCVGSTATGTDMTRTLLVRAALVARIVVLLVWRLSAWCWYWFDC